MELREIAKLLRQYGRPVVFVSLTVGIIAGIISRVIPPSFEVSQSLFISRQLQNPSSSFYGYDGFYSQQSAERFTDTVVGFLKSREVVKRAVTSSGFPLTVSGLDGVIERLRIKRTAPQLVTVVFKDNQRETAARFVESLGQEAIKLAESLNERGDRLLTINPLEDQASIEEKRLSALIISLSTFLSALLVLVLSLPLLEPVKELFGSR